jgi:nickel-dependent lactate racemase
MTTTIEVPQLPWHGAKPLELTLPDQWQVEVCNMAGCDRPPLNDDEIREAVADTIGTPPIRELAKGKKEVVILFDDLARPTRAAKIVPFVLEELASAGISDDRIRFVAAYGAHGPMHRSGLVKKLGEDVVARFPVYNHNIYENCTYVGTTSRGTKVSLNAEVTHCDFKVAINVTCPHHLVGFSGGAKMIIPGVASIDTIMANHTLEPDKVGFGADGGATVASPAYDDMEQAANLAGLDITIECTVNQWGDTVALFAGALQPAHRASVQEAKTHYLTPKAKDKDIVIANTYAKADEWGLALQVASSVKGSGGDFVLIANAPDGLVVHYLSLPWGTTVGGRIWKMRGGRRAIPANFDRLMLYTEYPVAADMRFFQDSPKVALMTDWDEVLEALQEVHGDGPAVAVYPSADIAYFA